MYFKAIVQIKMQFFGLSKRKKSSQVGSIHTSKLIDHGEVIINEVKLSAKCHPESQVKLTNYYYLCRPLRFSNIRKEKPVSG